VSNDSEVVKVRNVHHLLLAMFRNFRQDMQDIYTYIQDIQPFKGFSVILNFMTLIEPE